LKGKILEKLHHVFVKESTQLDFGGKGYKEESFTILNDKIEIYDIVDDLWDNGFEYEFDRIITIEVKYFQNIIDSVNKLYTDNYNLNTSLKEKSLDEKLQKYLFHSICTAYKHGGIDNLLNILDSNKIPYDNHVYSRQDSDD
jgi:hypothetical protein